MSDKKLSVWTIRVCPKCGAQEADPPSECAYCERDGGQLEEVEVTTFKQAQRLEAERDQIAATSVAAMTELTERWEAVANRERTDHEAFKERLLTIAREVEERGRATLKAGAARTGLFAEAAAIREAVAIVSEEAAEERG